MNLFLTLAFLFFIGSVLGWTAELFFRHFISAGNPRRKWINPGFCTGPYLPLYGFGLCLLYLIATAERFVATNFPFLDKLITLFVMAAAMTAIEYIAGIFCLKITKVRLWDYSDEKWNIRGIICPKFSLIWAILGAVYYFFVHSHILGSLKWLSDNLAFSFFIGLFFGIFIIDAINSAHLVAKLKTFAEENDVVVKYEAVKAYIRAGHEERKQKYSFFRPFRSDRPLSEYLKELVNSFESRRKKKGRNYSIKLHIVKNCGTVQRASAVFNLDFVFSLFRRK